MIQQSQLHVSIKSHITPGQKEATPHWLQHHQNCRKTQFQLSLKNRFIQRKHMGFSYVHQTWSNHGRAPGIQDPTKWLLHWDKLTKPNDRTNIFTIPIQTQVKKYYASINLQSYRLAQTANVVKEHHLQAESGGDVQSSWQTRKIRHW